VTDINHDKEKKIISVICFANYCRSPVAEKILQAKYHSQFKFMSAGIMPYADISMDNRSKEYLNEKGIKDNFHIPKKINSKLIDESSLIFAMDFEILIALNKMGISSDKLRLYSFQNKDVFIPDPFKLGKPEYKKIMDKIYQIADEMDFTFLGN